MVVNTTHLGGTAKDVVVGRVSHGLMLMGMGGTPDEVSFESIKAGVDALPPGAKMILNTGEFYSPTWGPENLELLGRFYAKYPDYADKTFLSVKGGLNGITPDSSIGNLRKCMATVERALGPYKKMDLYQLARVDPTRPIEETMANLVVLLKERHFSHIGMSECSAATLRRANAVYPVTAAEIEVSVWSYEAETKKVIETARELNISVLGYSPIGKGFLTGKLSKEDLKEGDHRARLTRLKDGNLEHNLQLVSKLFALAEKKGVTAAQLAIAWVAALGPHVIPLPGSSNATQTVENCQAGNIELSKEEITELTAMADAVQAEVKGDRCYMGGPETAHLWG
ncbi:aldo/keto reductase [Mycena polygramma]|nr:aldo/keto reductase [Mycena polygramma]